MSRKLVDEIKNKGIVRINNFLDPHETKRISNLIKYYSVPKDHPESYFPTHIGTLSLKILKLNFTKFFHSLQIWQLEREKRLRDLANNFFEKKTKLSCIDAYYSKISTREILPWHTDQAYSGKVNVKNFNNPNNYFLKIFIYLSDVGPNNGCMSYVPESHKIGYAIRKAIYENKIKYQPYWSLEDFKKIIKDNQSYFNNYFNDKNLLKNFMTKTNDLEIDKSENNFSYEAGAGTAIIFDEGGVYRGSKPQLNDRMVLRYLYCIK